MKTGIKEIDKLWKNQGQGELIVIGVENYGNWYLNRVLLPYIIYSTASEIDVRNQSKIPHYKRILRKSEEYVELTEREQKEAAVGIDYTLIIGNFPSLRQEYLPYFPFGNKWLKEKYAEHFDLFADLPIITLQEDSEERWPCNSLYDFERKYLNKVSLIATDYFPAGIGAIFADFGVHGYKYAKVLQELARTKNIPVFLVVPYHYKRDTEKFISFKNLNHLGVLMQYADKFILGVSNFNIPNKCFKDGDYVWQNMVYHPREVGLTFFLYDVHKRETHGFKNKIYNAFINKAYDKKNILQGTPQEILHKMVRNPDYCNEQNFSKYMKLSREENKKFWNYIEVFERCDMDELCEHIAAYKKDADSQELTLATLVLYRTVLGYFFDGDSHFSIYSDVSSIMISPKDSLADSFVSAALDSKNKTD